MTDPSINNNKNNNNEITQAHEFDQSPLFNFSKIEFFGLKFSNKCNDWDKFLEEFLLFRYSYFRVFYVEKNISTLAYFLNLMEGNFLIMKCDLICASIYNIKKIILSEKDENIKFKEMMPDYIQLVNLARIVIVYLIQLLYNYKIKLNSENITKFMKHDSELDSREDPAIKEKIIKYMHIKMRLPSNGERIGKFYYF